MSSETKRCPFCAEEIPAAAGKCTRCGSDLPAGPVPALTGKAPDEAKREAAAERIRESERTADERIKARNEAFAARQELRKEQRAVRDAELDRELKERATARAARSAAREGRVPAGEEIPGTREADAPQAGGGASLAASVRQPNGESGVLSDKQGDQRMSSETKRCPFCAEEILAAALKCKHCKSDLPAVAAAVAPATGNAAPGNQATSGSCSLVVAGIAAAAAGEGDAGIPVSGGTEGLAAGSVGKGEEQAAWVRTATRTYRKIRVAGVDGFTAVVAAVAWLIFPFTQYNRYTCGGFRTLLAWIVFTVVMSVAVIIVNEIRKAIKPDIIITGGSFSDMLKARVYWAIGPQCITIGVVWLVVSEVFG
ncbi:MAG: hypothetical protein A3K19_33705 [Lentisphaerae bacterium RIFOXYB12_FULL_65_16]|nr:MAG: hypothetical protein A3K19_30310 [Lentisphaerae bacterium RIFOXYB12_FULL_65_16]OGV95390.1 MAG: hypothetical protein A3K19_33705 [Lentisphaerae bacterium RIFOXYB12_FULL_65_16]